MPAQRLVTETRTKYKGQPTKIPVALAKEWKERTHRVTAQIQAFLHPAQPALLCFHSWQGHGYCTTRKNAGKGNELV